MFVECRSDKSRDMQDSVLITGGAGYIGSHICKALAKAGYRPITYDNLVHGHRWAVRWGPLETGDLLDQARLGHVFDRYRPLAVVHCAAFAYVGESMINPEKYYQNNVAGSLSLLQVSRRHLTPIVFSSSCATYGIPDRLPITECTQQQPINPYGATKLMVERMITDFGQAYGSPFAILRYFNVGGADADGKIGEDHTPETHLIPLVIDAASGRGSPITIFGADYDTPDGTCIRDYVHVSDLADAHVRAVQRLLAGGSPDAFNLGIGRGFSVREVVSAVERIAGRMVPVTMSSRRPGDPPALVSDATKAHKELSWKASYDELDAIIRTAWAWHQTHFSNDEASPAVVA